ncbi:MAG: TIGR03936 family radical SAM-associated protein [Phycisphaerae bacterium]
MGDIQVCTGQSSGQRYRYALVFSISGDVRFISHHDVLRMFRRALARASVPIRFSEGFNPHPRMMIPLPRPVGVASEVETIVLELSREVDLYDALQRLRQEMPAGVRLLNGRRLLRGERLAPKTVTYQLEVTDDAPSDLDKRIRAILESEVIEVKRANRKDKSVRTVDVRPYLADIRRRGPSVEFVLRITERGTARTAEIAGLLGYDPDFINHRVRRIEVQWQ